MFGAAIHRTAMPFRSFEHPTWKTFFGKLRGAFKIPTTEVIGNDLQQIEYKNVMAKVVCKLKQFSMICLTLDGATNVQGKQVINMMACGPIAFFLEHFTMELRRESAVNLYEKLIDCKRRLLQRERRSRGSPVTNTTRSTAQ
jgi:hypothetical protein